LNNSGNTDVGNALHWMLRFWQFQDCWNGWTYLPHYHKARSRHNKISNIAFHKIRIL
jgi:hypothetical protein